MGEQLARVREPGVFIDDDAAFVHVEHGHTIADEVEKRKIRKQYYLETRCDVLLKNKELFARWKKLGLSYMFLGVEAIDEEGLRRHRKRVSLGKSFEAIEYARSLGIMVAVNIIADPDWDEARFQAVREWALSVPEIVHLTVNTPYSRFKSGPRIQVGQSRNAERCLAGQSAPRAGAATTCRAPAFPHLQARLQDSRLADLRQRRPSGGRRNTPPGACFRHACRGTGPWRVSHRPPATRRRKGRSPSRSRVASPLCSTCVTAGGSAGHARRPGWSSCAPLPALPPSPFAS